MIPEEAIRLRILANSDSAKDQWLKREIRNRVNEEITIWVEQLDNIENARTVIESRLDRIEEIVTNELFKVGIDDEFTVEFDEVQFPTKLYGNIVYPAGIYESVLITIGEGKGENWWCVLFPPLCFVDFTNGDAIETDQDHQTVTEEVGEEVEVRFFVVELFDSIVDGVKSWFS
ncbi:MAG: stage II sporulation protein R [Bacillaceae bacterium]|nr:stage II sporulation protein R [Bacillaceae bacterium]